jgi:glycosyltransferase involved in cell wall biosynthesis
MKIGIVLTGFFCGDYLAEAVKSIQLQEDLDWNCAIVFDPSEQGVVIDELTLKDRRFVLIQSKPLNVCAARNQGYAAIDGELLFSLDGDDLIGPHYISTLRRLMYRPEVVLAYTGTRYFGEFDGIKYDPEYSPRLLAIRNPIVSSAMIRRADFFDVGGYDERLEIGYEDWDLWISILKRGGEVAFDPFPHFMYRQRLRSRSRQISYERETEAKEYIFNKHRDFCWHSRRMTGARV